MLTPITAGFDVFHLGEGFSEGGEGFVVEGAASGVAAVTEEDADFHRVAPRLGGVG